MYSYPHSHNLLFWIKNIHDIRNGCWESFLLDKPKLIPLSSACITICQVWSRCGKGVSFTICRKRVFLNNTYRLYSYILHENNSQKCTGSACCHILITKQTDNTQGELAMNLVRHCRRICSDTTDPWTKNKCNERQSVWTPSLPRFAHFQGQNSNTSEFSRLE